MYPVRRQISPHAARLRRDATEVERQLWAVLRNRQLDGFKFRFQSSVGPYVADFLCVEAKLIVELDGGQHSEERDAARTRFLEQHGYRVLRFWNNEVVESLEGVVMAIKAALAGAPDR
jgi:very-short-patch-repair endonuclease